MKLLRYDQRPPMWDQLIAGYPNKSLFHESAWLDFVEEAYPRTEVEYFEIWCGSELAGYFCAVKTRKYLLKVWEAPQSCIYMSPLVHPHVDQLELMQLLVAACKTGGIAHLALCDPWLAPDLMTRSGFTAEYDVTHACPLTDGSDSVWARMDGTCRTRIRKAEKSGLTVEESTDPGFVDDFYSLYSRVLADKGKQLCYDINQVRLLFKHLGGADRLFALRVRHEGRVIATAFYPHDDRVMYFGEAGYEAESLPLCPNNLLHWTAMQMAMERGIPLFHMGGGPQPSRFTQKFGGSLKSIIKYRRSFLPLLDQARRAYHLLQAGKVRTLWHNLPMQWNRIRSSLTERTRGED